MSSSSGLDRFFGFANGMIAGTSLIIKGGLKFSLCSLSKSSRCVFKLRANKTHSIKELSIA